MSTEHSISIRTPSDFSFWKTVYSHGWCALLPFYVDKETPTLKRVLTLQNGSILNCTIVERDRGLNATLSSKKILSQTNKDEARKIILSSLRLEETFGAFYKEARKIKKYHWIPRIRAGRLLRSPTVFEDIVKMICTTNCSWALTTIMVQNLCEEFGERAPDGSYAFPRPVAIARSTEQFLRKRIRAGYRALYLLEFAKDVAGKKLDPESFRSSPLPTLELRKKLISIKGIGPYAADNLLKLLGRYDYLGLDSWVRKRYYDKFQKGKSVDDKTIERRYRSYGEWRGLFFWLEMTQEFYEHDFPF